jgi:hypothetical protein
MHQIVRNAPGRKRVAKVFEGVVFRGVKDKLRYNAAADIKNSSGDLTVKITSS